ncbi:MAG: ferrous iron transport protein A [Candidatus Marinimicrobia bacterium]|nr:ferrous iron transport protein A [Candidatus Neomarinimicrobiota bacterium]
MTIAQLSTDDVARIVGFSGSLELQSRLVEMGFLPGVLIRLIKRSAFGGPFQLKVRDYYVSLRKNDSENIIVEKLI